MDAGERQEGRASSGAYASFLGAGMVVLAGLLMLSLPSWSVASSRTVELAFLDGIAEADALVATGYVGCADICPTQLSLLAQVRRARAAAGLPVPALFFLNVDLGGSREATEAFAAQFDTGFRSAVVEVDQAADLEGALALRSYADRDRLLDHAGTIYLFRRQADNTWRLRRAFVRRTDVDAVLSALGGRMENQA